ncbi:MAG: hypothetical protein COB41_00315 [Proteobacteria bacterium]|nr:MAG: hypothetical protein COB41_00315 [Pseudomonadota bacterium]
MPIGAPPPSSLDGNQVLQHAFIDDTGQIRVSATLNPGGSSEVIISHLDDSIKIGDGVDLVTTTSVSSDVGLDVNVIGGTIDVSGTDLDIRDLNSSQDNVAIKNENGDALLINPDGSINVNASNSQGSPNNTYNEISSVAASTPSTIVSYMAPVGKTTYLQKIKASGTNIAQYEVKVNGSVIDKGYTYFGSSLSTLFDFTGNANNGYLLTVGDLVILEVTHIRGGTGDFNGRIQSIEV